MLEIGKRYETPKEGWIQITRRTPEQMSFERLLKPSSGKADPHLHQDLVQTWECVSGRGAMEVDGERREFNAGDRIELAREMAHRDPFTEGTDGRPYRAGIPTSLQKASLPLVKRIAALRGYRASYD